MRITYPYALAVAFAALISGTIFASSVETVQIPDGGSAYCNDQNDVVKGIYGAYKAKATSVAYDNAVDQFTFHVAINFLSCTLDKGTIAFVSASPTAKTTYKTKISKDKELSVTVTPLESRLRTYVDGDYLLLHDLLLTAKSEQSFDLSFPAVSLLTDAQLSALSAGQTIKSSVDLYIYKTIRWLASDGTTDDSALNYGSFRIWFEIQSTERGMRITLLQD